MRLTKLFKDNTSGINGCPAAYLADGPPDTYTGADRAHGHVFQGPGVDSALLDQVSDGELGVWLPANVTDRFVETRLREVGLVDEADRYQRITDAAV